jgi:hypothetical protein
MLIIYQLYWLNLKNYINFSSWYICSHLNLIMYKVLTGLFQFPPVPIKMVICIKISLFLFVVGPGAQSVYRLATGWTGRASNPGGGEIFRSCPDRLWGTPSLLYNGYRVFSGVECGRGVTLTPYPLVVPRSKSRGGLYIALFSLRAFLACE